MRRRQFIAGLGVAVSPLAARAQQSDRLRRIGVLMPRDENDPATRVQQSAPPVVGYVNGGTADAGTPFVAKFRTGLRELGYVEGQNVSVEYHFLEGRFDRMPALMEEWVQRRVAVIVTAGTVAGALAAKAATTTIPIVFGVNDNPVRLGLVASFARPGGNLTGLNFFSQEAVPKRLGLLHELVPKVNRVAMLINPSNLVASETALREAQNAVRVVGLSIDILKASTSREIDEVFAAMVREQIGALLIAGDSYLTSRHVQIATLGARHAIATSSNDREFVRVGGLMSYGPNLVELNRQLGLYTGQILKGAKPADLPVQQPTKFEFIINAQTARALGIDVPATLLAQADEVIE
jgi:putative tryptophan/tyrosine transport system substrate-binding protein